MGEKLMNRISVLALTLLSVGAAYAQQAPDPDAIKLGNIDFSGSLRLRLYGWDWFQAKTGENSYVYSGNLLRFSFAENLDTWDWDAEFAVPFLLGLPSTATVAAPQGGLGLGSNYFTANHSDSYTAMIFPKQLFFRLHDLGTQGSSLQVGRFEFFDGLEVIPKNATLATVKRDHVSQRLISNFGFSDVQRSFDGLHYSWSPSSSDNITFVSAVPDRGVFQVDGWGWNRIGFGYLSYTHEWGHGRHSADTRIFDIEYDDFRHILKTDNRALAIRKTDTENIVINTFGGHSVHAIESSAGTFDLVFWGAVQTGRWGTQTQSSGAFVTEAGYQPRVLPAVKPWLRGGYTYGSGDSNPKDNTHGTFFQLLPTPRLYARFPFFNMMNMEDAYGSLILRPHPKVTVSSEFHSLRLTDPQDLWYSGGGAYQPWTFGYTGRSASGARSVGDLYDTQIDYRLHPKVTATGYFGYVEGLSVMRTIYPEGKDGRFGYLELLVRF
jgi:hypothetical protein